MPRHVAEPTQSPWSVRWGAALVSLVLVGVVGAGGFLTYQVLGTNGDDVAGEPVEETADEGCADAGRVRLFASPEIATTVDQAIEAGLADEAVTSAAAAAGPLDLSCLDLEVDARDSRTTLAALAEGTAGRVDLWLPDSSIWVGRAASLGVASQVRGTLGTANVVVATSPEAAAELGWDAEPPTWRDVLAAPRPLAVPDFSASSPALLGLAAAGVGIEDQAEQGELAAAAVLGQERSGVAGDVPVADLLGSVAGAGEDAGVTVLGEYALARATAGQDGIDLVALSPAGPVPFLDYPLLDLEEFDEPEHQRYVDLVVAALTSAPGQAVLADSGLASPTAPGEQALPVPDAQQDAALLTAVAALERPSRILVVMDVSTSMSAEVEPGVTRADVAGEAALRALGLLPDTSSVGLWLFASELEGEQDWQVAEPVARLDEFTDGTSQREELAVVVSTLSDRLRSGGTSLYDVTLAAVEEGWAIWDEDAVTTVVVITDGRNEDSTGTQLEELTETLATGADPERPIGLTMVAFGPDADLEAIQTIVDAAQLGGTAQAVDARDPNVLAELLISTISARVREGATAG